VPESPRALAASRSGDRLRERLIGLGYHEAITSRHVAEERNDLFRPPDAQVAKLANPFRKKRAC